MSHSTTATATYVLQKYSKSYPKPEAQQNASSTAEACSEWQHFTNPVIRLVLDITKASNTELESVRLRIKWSMDAENVSSTYEQNVVLFVSSAVQRKGWDSSHCIQGGLGPSSILVPSAVQTPKEACPRTSPQSRIP